MNSEELKKIRLKYGLFQSELADIIGCYQCQISTWENGKVQISDKRLREIMNTLERVKNENRV